MGGVHPPTPPRWDWGIGWRPLANGVVGLWVGEKLFTLGWAVKGGLWGGQWGGQGRGQGGLSTLQSPLLGLGCWVEAIGQWGGGSLGG